MIPLNPADYELIKPARSGKPWPAFKCYYCGKPASYRETFEVRDREGRCYTRGVCDDCYQAAREGRHDGIICRQRRSKHSGKFAGKLIRPSPGPAGGAGGHCRGQPHEGDLPAISLPGSPPPTTAISSGDSDPASASGRPENIQ